MEPSAQHRRRRESMDPVLCLADGCYVSNGPEYPASFLHGRKATRFGNAISRRAGACNRAYTCVFRNVEIGDLPAEIQPVDIRVLRHDRRAPESVDALSTCRGTSGRLACTGAIQGDGYTMWVIPEQVAARLPVELFGVTNDGGDRDDPRSAMAPSRGRW
jgi:colicin import membrane protein